MVNENFKLTNRQRYLQEYEKYKDVVLETGLYVKKDSSVKIEILDIKRDKITIKTVDSGFVNEKTPHWCRKYLERLES